jgi:hypothetical protein
MTTVYKRQYTILRPGMGSLVGDERGPGVQRRPKCPAVDLGGPLPYHGASNSSLFPAIFAMQRRFGELGTESFPCHHEHFRAL